MDPVRFGLAIRALRRRHGWTQAELATKAGISQSAVSRIERGEGDHLTPRLLARVAEELGARIRVSITAHGEDLDRLLDAGHAELVEVVAKLLRDRGWVVVPEATFSVYGERGSIDILAFHPATGALLVVEVKSTVPDVQATLAGIDRKERSPLASRRDAAGTREACRAGSSSPTTPRLDDASTSMLRRSTPRCPRAPSNSDDGRPPRRGGSLESCSWRRPRSRAAGTGCAIAVPVSTQAGSRPTFWVLGANPGPTDH